MSAVENHILGNGEKVDARWEIVRKLGQGAFGAVFEVKDTTSKTKGPKAMKIESIASADHVLKIEVAVLTDLQGKDHVCQMYAAGKNAKFNFMVMTLLGPSLTILRKKAKDKKFSKATTMAVTWQCVKALRDMHDAGWLHRDVKPSNFAIGLQNEREDKRRTVFVLDFGLSRMFRLKDGTMKPPREVVGFRGTLRYCPLNAHKSIDLGRQDDLVSLLYMMLEMLTGSLPWKSHDAIEEVKNIKETRAPELLNAVSPMFDNVYKHLDQLQFTDTPDYEIFHEALNEVLSTERKTMDTPFDWDCQGRSTRTASRKSTKEIVSRTRSRKPR